MATRLKTVKYAFPPTAAVTDNTLTTMTQITVYLPDAPVAFRSVVAELSIQSTLTAAGNITSRNLQCRLGAAGYTANSNANLYTGSGLPIHLFHAVDLTSHFTTNWTGTSMTMDAQVQVDGTGTGIAWTNCCVTVTITYEYDDTSATQVKTVYIPLNAPVGAFATTKPGTATATIPDLSTELPEASKVFRSTHIVVQGNTAHAAATTDLTLTMQLDSTAAHTSGIFEGLGNADQWFRYVWDCSGVLTTSAAMSFYLWGNGAKFNHAQAWLVVTYEFDASAANDVFVSLILPMAMASPMGGTASTDAQRGFRQLFIEEPGTITTKQIAFYAFWEQAGAIGGLNMRIGTGSYVTYTDTAALTAGGNGAMIRNDSAFTLDRGRQVLTADFYRTDTTDFGFNLSGFWIVNYTAGKPTQGYGAANHTVFQHLGSLYSGAAAATLAVSATAPVLTEANYYMNALGTCYSYITNTTGTSAGVSVMYEKVSAEGGPSWESAYTDISHTDPETGLRQCWSQMRDDFKRWTGDPDANRLDIETSRRWRVAHPNAVAVFHFLQLVWTYHGITFTVAGDITNSAGGTVHLDLVREATGEVVMSTSRVGNGSYSFTWYDDTELLYVVAYESGTLLGRSANGYAS